jgi:hypothetical protein
LPLSIQKSAAKLRCCQFRNQQPKTVAANSEICSEGGVISVLLLFFKKSSGSDDDNVSLGADQEKAPMSTHDAAFSSMV